MLVSTRSGCVQLFLWWVVGVVALPGPYSTAADDSPTDPAFSDISDTTARAFDDLPLDELAPDSPSTSRRRTRAQQTSRQGGPFSEMPTLGGMPWSTSGRETEPAREEYPHIFSTDVWDRRSFWYTNRPNILNMQVRANWDAMKVINTDRPDFTDVATVVGKKVVQVETGWTFRERQQPDLISDQNTLPESLLRVGVSDHFEWRIKWDGGYTWSRTHDYDTGLTSSTAGGSDTTLGFKWIVKDQDDWMPLQTIVTRLSVPTGVPAYSANTVQPGISYIYNWQVRRWWFIRGATGLDWLNHAGPIFTTAGGPSSNIEFGHDYQVQCAQSISSYFQIAPRLGMFMEWFILMHAKSADNRPDNYHDYGVYYYLTPNLQLDARIGQRFSGPGFNEWFTGAGISFRLQE